MRKIILILLLLITISGYSQRLFKTIYKYDISNKKLEENNIKFAYWINNKDKFVCEYNEKTFEFTILSETKRENKEGDKFTEFDLMSDEIDNQRLLIQVFDDKSCGMKMYAYAPIYYQLFE